MTQTHDPVCGANVETETAVAQATVDGQALYFCSSGCMTQYQANPEKFRDRSVPESGGLESERLPESHDKR